LNISKVEDTTKECDATSVNTNNLDDLVLEDLMKVDNVVVDAIKLKLLNYSNVSIAKIVVNKNRKGKVTQCRLLTNTKLIFNKLVLIKSIQKS